MASLSARADRPQPPPEYASVPEVAFSSALNEQGHYVDERSALHRVAALVARGATPEETFGAVATEAGQLMDATFTILSRFHPDATFEVIGAWNSNGSGGPLPVGARMPVQRKNAATVVFQTGRLARINDCADTTGSTMTTAHARDTHASVAVPITVDGRLWGLLVAASRAEQLPPGTEARLSGFTDLVAIAISNAEAHATLAASRARLVEAADVTSRRIERDLHDGAQQRLVSLALRLRSSVRAAVPPGAHGLVVQLDGVAAELEEILEGLREIARGIHPAVLAEGGLRPALRGLARRSAIPVEVDVRVDGRLPEQVELAAYYVVSEALTNAAKHADASAVDVQVAASDGMLDIAVRDDGSGGANAGRGSGLTGLTDRAEALGGQLTIQSAPGSGTALQISLPIEVP